MNPEEITPSMEFGKNIDYEKELNPSQLEAVINIEGAMLVIAGAGSGKTRTLTYRVARLVEAGIAPYSILLLTFTRKASQEMLERSVSLLDARCGKVSGGTFHSFANTLLRRHAHRIGFDSNYTIIDRSDAESLISVLRKELKLAAKGRSFPTKRTLADIFSRSVNKNASVESIVEDELSHLTGDLEEILRLHKLYGDAKRENNVFDYDDLLVNLHLLLKTQPEVAQWAAETYRYIMVDEYQDTNAIQAEVLFLIGHKHENIMVVGDDSQSIYAFRGANFENIMAFPKTYPNAKVITLEENYRSTQPILDLTNMVIGKAKRKYSKRLFTRRMGGNLPTLVQTLSEKHQSRFVIETIGRLRKQGTPLNEIAVLIRAGFHSFDLEIELNREGIPFVKVGGFKFMESAHIKDMLAHIAVLVNPSDRISWLRILSLLEKIGPKTAQKIYETVQKGNLGYRGLSEISDKTLAKKQLDGLKTLFVTLQPESMTAGQVGALILDYYAKILKNRFDDHPKRMRDLEQLLVIMERYTRLDAFLADMALEPPTSSVDGGLAQPPTGEDRLTVSTVHSAKGLEWDTVFIVWALDGRFPSMYAVSNDEEIEEELRLMYVAATRAREELFFVSPAYAYDRASDTILNQPSRFIEDLPEEILFRIYPDAEDWQAIDYS